MAVTTNYSWSTPDDTALVKDGAAAIRSLGTAIDTTVFNNAGAAIAKTIVDAKGDIIAATAADTVSRLAVGANDTVLTADSTTATGLKWATPSGGGSSFTLLNTGGTALTGAATVTVSGISAINKLMVRLSSASSVNDGDSIGIRLNTDTGSNYYATQNRIVATSSYSSSNIQASGPGASDVVYLGVMSFQGSGVSGGMYIDGCNTTNLKIFSYVGGANQSGNGQTQYSGMGHYTGSSVISSVSVFSSSGNFDGGTVFIYGSAV